MAALIKLIFVGIIVYAIKVFWELFLTKGFRGKK